MQFLGMAARDRPGMAGRERPGMAARERPGMSSRDRHGPGTARPPPPRAHQQQQQQQQPQRFKFGGETHVTLHLVDEQRFCSATSDDGASYSGAQLKPALWSKLPRELVTMVLRRLPHSSRARLRAVNRAWRAQLSVPAPASAALLQSEVAFVAIRREEGVEMARDARCLTHQLDLTAFPPHFHNWEENRHDGRGYGVFTGKGLVCKADYTGVVQDKKLRQFRVWVMDWRSKGWLELPALVVKDLQQHREDWFLGTTSRRGSSGTPASFKVVLSRGHKVLNLSVYSSVTGVWTSSTVHPLDDLPNVGSRSSFSYAARCLCDNLLYSLVQRDTLEQLLVLCVDDGLEVRRFKDVPGKCRNSSVYLADHDGRPVLVRKKAGLNDGAACEAWTLPDDDGEFEPLATLPDQLLSELRVSSAAAAGAGAAGGAAAPFSYDVLQVEVARDLLFLTLSSNYQNTHLVAYHMLRKTWRVVFHDAKHCWRFQYLEPKPSLRL